MISFRNLNNLHEHIPANIPALANPTPVELPPSPYPPDPFYPHLPPLTPPDPLLEVHLHWHNRTAPEPTSRNKHLFNPGYSPFTPSTEEFESTCSMFNRKVAISLDHEFYDYSHDRHVSHPGSKETSYEQLSETAAKLKEIGLSRGVAGCAEDDGKANRNHRTQSSTSIDKGEKFVQWKHEVYDDEVKNQFILECLQEMPWRTDAMIAKVAGCSDSHVRRARVKNGIPTPRSDPEFDLVRRLAGDHGGKLMSVNFAAGLLGVEVSEIERLMDKYDVGVKPGRGVKYARVKAGKDLEGGLAKLRSENGKKGARALAERRAREAKEANELAKQAKEMAK